MTVLRSFVYSSILPNSSLPQGVMFRSYTRWHVVSSHVGIRRSRIFMSTGEVRDCSRASRTFSCPYHQFRPLVGESHDEPLRILYCGSDNFSCAILQALHEEYQHPSSNIASIDVVCREGKPYGRGLRSIRHRMSVTSPMVS